MQYDIQNPAVLRAAISVLPGRHEIRQYLQGLYIHYQTGRVVSTDNHRLLVAGVFKPGADGAPPQILKFIGKNPNIPKSADRAVLDTGVQTLTIYKKHNILSVHHYEILDSTYPDYSRIIHGYKSEGAAVLDFGINAEYLADVQKALGSRGCKLSPREDAGRVIKVDFENAPPDFEYYVMPMKV